MAFRGSVSGAGKAAGAGVGFASGLNRGGGVSLTDRVLGDGGNTTIYQRRDGSQYALDREGRRAELPLGTAILGPAKFDARAEYQRDSPRP